MDGIGFTISIFITNLAFAGESNIINASKKAIPAASLTARTNDFLSLKVFGKPEESDENADAMEFEITLLK